MSRTRRRCTVAQGNCAYLVEKLEYLLKKIFLTYNINSCYWQHRKIKNARFHLAEYQITIVKLIHDPRLYYVHTFGRFSCATTFHSSYVKLDTASLNGDNKSVAALCFWGPNISRRRHCCSCNPTLVLTLDRQICFSRFFTVLTQCFSSFHEWLRKENRKPVLSI